MFADGVESANFSDIITRSELQCGPQKFESLNGCLDHTMSDRNFSDSVLLPLYASAYFVEKFLEHSLSSDPHAPDPRPSHRLQFLKLLSQLFRPRVLDEVPPEVLENLVLDRFFLSRFPAPFSFVVPHPDQLMVSLSPLSCCFTPHLSVLVGHDILLDKVFQRFVFVPALSCQDAVFDNLEVLLGKSLFLLK